MREYLIKLLGGFTINSIKNSPERHEVLTLLVEDLYNTVGKDDILRLDEYGNLTFMGKVLSKQQVDVIATQADSFIDSFLWKVLDTDIKYQANRKMFTDSTEIIHLESGKLLLYMLDIIRTRLNKLRSLQK